VLDPGLLDAEYVTDGITSSAVRVVGVHRLGPCGGNRKAMVVLSDGVGDGSECGSPCVSRRQQLKVGCGGTVWRR